MNIFDDLDALKKICDDNDILSTTFREIAEHAGKPTESWGSHSKGIAVRFREAGVNMIAIDDTLPPEERYFTFAHELGHVLLEHLTNRREKIDAAETEADVFAATFTAMRLFLQPFERD